MLSTSSDEAVDPSVISWSDCSAEEKLGYLKQLANEKDIDYVKLNKDLGIPRDYLAVLNSDNFREIMRYFAVFLPSSQRGFQACGDGTDKVHLPEVFRKASERSFWSEPPERWPEIIRFFQYYAEFNGQSTSAFVTMLSCKDYDGICDWLLKELPEDKISLDLKAFALFSLPEELRSRLCAELFSRFNLEYHSGISCRVLALPLIFSSFPRDHYPQLISAIDQTLAESPVIDTIIVVCCVVANLLKYGAVSKVQVQAWMKEIEPQYAKRRYSKTSNRTPVMSFRATHEALSN